MLIDIITNKGSYKKYKPTYDEIFDFFFTLSKESFIKPHDLGEILKINLTKWGMEEYYIKLLKQIKQELKKYE